MERDFLYAIGRKEKASEAVKEETRAEPDCPGGVATAMQWQFLPKSGAAPAFMSFRTAREEGSREFSISEFRPPAVGDAVDSIKKHASSPGTSQQRQFGFDTPVMAQQYAKRIDHSAATHHLLVEPRMVQPLSSHHPVSFNQANPVPRTQSLHSASGGLLKCHPLVMSNGFGGSTVGTYGVRNPRSQNSSQLAIFYNGTVNVFDNVSVEKAQQLMLLASKASISSPPSVVRKPDSPISAPAKINAPEVLPARQIVTWKPEHSVSHLATASSQISIMPQPVAPHRSISNCTTDPTGPKTDVRSPVVVHTSQASSSASPLATTSFASVMPKAVPQARKASLARFLEKRKERVTSVEPYPTSKSPLESSDTKVSANALSKSSFGIAPTSNNEESHLCFGQPRNISFSTKMQI